MRRRALTVAGAALFGVLPATAIAHGPAPAALEVLSLRDGRPAVVRLNFGLAVAMAGDPEHFHYVCPARWGEAERVPEIAALPDGRLVVPLTDAVWLGDAVGGDFVSAEAPGWRAQTPVGHATGDRTTLVTRDATGARFWGVDTAAGAVRPEDTLPGVALDSVSSAGPAALWAVGARPAPTLWHRDAAGLASTPLALDAAPQFLDLRPVDAGAARGHLFLAASVADGARLFETTNAGGEVVERLRADRALHGPVPLGDALVAVADGVVWHRPAGAADFTAGEPRAFTCLQAIGGHTLACLDRQLVELSGPASAPEASAFFSLSQLLGPEPGTGCDEQWLHFGAEAGLLRADAGEPAESVDAGTVADAEVVPAAFAGSGGGGGAGGCGPAGPRPGPLGAVLCALSGACLAALRRRPRSNFSRPRRSRKLRAIFRSDAQRAGRSQGG